MSEPGLKEAVGGAGNVYAITTIWAAIFLFPMIFISGEFSKMEARARRRRPAATAPLLSFMSPNYSHGAAQPPPPSHRWLPPGACLVEPALWLWTQAEPILGGGARM